METNKRLYRSTKDKIIAGLCGGIANYFNIDPVIIRLIMVVLFFISGWGILAYIIGWIIVPKESCKTNPNCCEKPKETQEQTETPETTEPQEQTEKVDAEPEQKI